MSRYDGLGRMREAKFAALDNLLRRIHGPATAFSAVAPSQQPALAAHRSNYSGVVLPQGPNSWPLNIPAAWPVPPILRH